MEQYALLEWYIGDLPGEMADPNTQTSSYSKWRRYDQLTCPEPDDVMTTDALVRAESPRNGRRLTAGAMAASMAAPATAEPDGKAAL